MHKEIFCVYSTFNVEELAPLSVGISILLYIVTYAITVFIIYPSMYCSKYRPYQAVENKPADRIFRITTV